MDGKSLRSWALIIILLARILSLQAMPLIMMKRMLVSNPSVERESNSSCSCSSIIINESYDINKAKLRFIFLIGIVGALSRNGST